MSDKVTDFPQYRKLSNEKVFYKINNDRHFDEIQIVGKSAYIYSIEAKQYPEILKIQDLIHFTIEGFEPSTEEEFNSFLEKYKQK